MAAACACHKESVVDLTDAQIVLSAVETGDTKALLDVTTFAKKGNQLHIYDYYTPKAGAPTYHIDDQVESQGSYIWPFVGQRYSWTPDGVHKFYGWMHKDDNENPALTAESFFGKRLELDKTNQRLDVPEKVISQGTAQFDFMYSDIYERNLNENPDYMSPVELKFSHLFTSFGIAAKNVSTNITYRLRSVQVEGLVTSASAVIDFSDDEKVGVSYNNRSNANGNTPDYSFTFDNRLVLSSTLTDIATRESAEDDRQYFIAWPMTAEQAGQVKITIVYDNGGNTSTTKTLTLSEDAWEPGKKNNINIVFIDKEVHLICTVVDWTYEEEEMQFTDVVTIHEDGKLKWKDTSINSFNTETGEVLIKSNGTPAVGEFHIETPLGATWHASLIPIGEGQVDAFEFVDGSNTGQVGKDHAIIKIRAKNTENLANVQKAILRITVSTSDGRTMVVNELTPAGASYKEFTIVQNMI